jgi:hypothetical protein
MAYYKVLIEVWCDWNPAESDLEEIIQNTSAGEARKVNVGLPPDCTVGSTFGVSRNQIRTSRSYKSLLYQDGTAGSVRHCFPMSIPRRPSDTDPRLIRHPPDR